jgi:hypothetical protein
MMRFLCPYFGDTEDMALLEHEVVSLVSDALSSGALPQQEVSALYNGRIAVGLLTKGEVWLARSVRLPSWRGDASHPLAKKVVGTIGVCDCAISGSKKIFRKCAWACMVFLDRSKSWIKFVFSSD